MSLTSYRAAPPRVNFLRARPDGLAAFERGSAPAVCRPWRGPACSCGLSRGGHRDEGIWIVLGRPGNDLLSRVLRHSTIGAVEFNGRVRDGIGFGLHARVTGPAKDKGIGRRQSSDGSRGTARCGSGRPVRQALVVSARRLQSVLRLPTADCRCFSGHGS